MIQKITADLSQLSDQVITGPLQINDDFPGFFLRGDATLYYAICLENILESIKKDINPDPVYEESLQKLLRSFRGSRISSIEDDYDTDVGC